MSTSFTRSAVVFAYSAVGYECLKELINGGINVKAVYTHKDNPDEKLWFSSVRELAVKNNIPVYEAEDPLKEATRINEMKPDLIFSFYYRLIIPETILKLASLGAFNMHGSLLPRYRGRACVNWAVLNGETETGMTLHRMTARADRGEIIGQESVSIGPNETAHEVFLKLIPAACLLLRSHLPAIINGKAKGIEQDEGQASYFGRRRPEDGLLNWNKPARQLHNLVRAVTHPFPGAFTFFNGKKIYVWRTAISEIKASAGTLPGTVISSMPFIVATGEGALTILNAQPDGEAELTKNEAKGVELNIPKGSILGD